MEGLTCYEGLSREDMNRTYGDYEEEDYEGFENGDFDDYDESTAYHSDTVFS